MTTNTPAGFIISWALPDVVPLQKLRDGLKSANLLPDELAPDLKPAQMVARLAGYIAKHTSVKDIKKLARPIGHTSRQITREEKDAGDLRYTREAQIKLNEITLQIECDDPEITKQLPQLTTMIFETRTASDVTRIIQRIVEEAGSDMIPVRDQGGAYFIPSGHTVMGKLATVLQGVDGELSQFACTLGHGSDESVANTITDYLLKQVKELEDSVAELGEKKVRSDVKSRRLSRVAELRDKMRAYESLIGLQGSKLSSALGKAEEMLLARLGPDEPEPAAEPAVS